MVSPQDPRLESLVEGIIRIARGDLKTRIRRSPARDEIDAIITGINLMAEDLQTVYQELEDRVESRTALLQQAHLDMQRMALTDPLTLLSNRTALTLAMDKALEASARGELPPAVLMLDLDSFKGINDSLGHSAGDEVLEITGRRLQASVRETDTVARLGGDEFVVMLPAATMTRARRVAARILTSINQPIAIGHRSVLCGTSIGLRLGQPGQSAEQLLLEADTAMYAAKAEGRGRIKAFEPLMLQARQMQKLMSAELRIALNSNQLVLHYQPVVELATKRIEGVEALVRWNHPARGLLMPDAFIPIAEEIGVIAELGRWVLRTAVDQLRQWQADRVVPPGFALRINMSAAELQRVDLIDDVRETLASAQVSASDLIIELTESTVVTGNDLDQYSLNGLRKLGVGLEIDDFGTGYSSISYLRKLPVNVVKVDRSLIDELGTNEGQREFVAAILQLIRASGLEALVEGIESKEQADELLAMGCRSGQGYYFGRPVPAGELAQLLPNAVGRLG